MSNQIPSNLLYTKEHEWTLIENDMATIGITDFAQNSLGDIVFVETPDKGSEIKQNQTFGVVESIKSVSDLYAPLTGQVLETNSELQDNPEKINQSPYDSWIIKIKIINKEEISSLMSPEKYSEFCQSEH